MGAAKNSDLSSRLSKKRENGHQQSNAAHDDSDTQQRVCKESISRPMMLISIKSGHPRSDERKVPPNSSLSSIRKEPISHFIPLPRLASMSSCVALKSKLNSSPSKADMPLNASPKRDRAGPQRRINKTTISQPHLLPDPTPYPMSSPVAHSVVPEVKPHPGPTKVDVPLDAPPKCDKAKHQRRINKETLSQLFLLPDWTSFPMTHTFEFDIPSKIDLPYVPPLNIRQPRHAVADPRVTNSTGVPSPASGHGSFCDQNEGTGHDARRPTRQYNPHQPRSSQTHGQAKLGSPDESEHNLSETHVPTCGALHDHVSGPHSPYFTLKSDSTSSDETFFYFCSEDGEIVDDLGNTDARDILKLPDCLETTKDFARLL